MCGAEREDLKHFMSWCPVYTQERRKSEGLRQPYTEEDDVIGQYLFDKKLIEETKRTLHTLWKIREKKIKEKEDGERDSQ